MTQQITVEIDDWNGKKNIGLDTYVKSFTDQTRDLYHVLGASTIETKDLQVIKDFSDWLEGKAVVNFTELWKKQNTNKQIDLIGGT